MSPLLDDQDALGPGEAYQRCMQELGKPYPDHEPAQLYATLSVEETLRDVAGHLAELTKQIALASRR
jgi:hypothetical protein